MNSDMRYRRSEMFRMQFEKTQGCHVLLYPEGMVQLSDSAAEILSQFETPTLVAEVIARLESKFPGVELADDVNEFVEIACDKKWLQAC